MKTLYFECTSGISGDMTAAALLDLGADEQVLRKALESLHLNGWHLHISRTSKCGISACDFGVPVFRWRRFTFTKSELWIPSSTLQRRRSVWTILEPSA